MSARQAKLILKVNLILLLKQKKRTMNLITKFQITTIVIFLFLLLPANGLFAQSHILSLIPDQNALNVPKDANIEVVFDVNLDEHTLNGSTIIVYANRTGLHFGSVTYDEQIRAVLFDPYQDFNAGEWVTVTLTSKIKLNSGHEGSLNGFTWHFTVAVDPEKGGRFVLKQELPVGNGMWLLGADFNNDSYPDMATMDDWWDQVYLYLNDQTGNFYYYKPIILERGYPIMEACDINLDGNIDIHFMSGIASLLNNGNTNFTFTDYEEIPAGGGIIGDVDNDGDMDMATHIIDDILSIYKNDGQGIFYFYSQCFLKRGMMVSYCQNFNDLNSDGFLDIVTYTYSYPDTPAVLLNDGTGSFTVSQYYEMKLATTFANIYGNDFDGDGDIDIIMTGAKRADDYKNILFNRGDGTFDFGEYQIPRQFGHVNGGDIDGDGDIDFIFGGGWSHTPDTTDYEGAIRIVYNDGLGNFQDSTEYEIISPVGPVELVDVDQDGDLDILGIYAGPNGGPSFYNLQNVEPTSVDQKITSEMVKVLQLSQNFPNPFNSQTVINYQVPNGLHHVSLKIYNIHRLLQNRMS